MEEIWRKILINPAYEISNTGQLRCWSTYRNGEKALYSPVIVKQSKDEYGYWRSSIRVKMHNRRIVLIHRLMAEAFLPKINGKLDVNHINGIKSDNSLSNLEWCSHAENIKHAYDTGLFKITPESRVSYRKLSNDQVLEIYNHQGGWDYLKEKFGISKTQIHRIKIGENWAAITGGKNNIKRPCARKKW